jgi:hypothetical protein
MSNQSATNENNVAYWQTLLMFLDSMEVTERCSSLDR